MKVLKQILSSLFLISIFILIIFFPIIIKYFYNNEVITSKIDEKEVSAIFKIVRANVLNEMRMESNIKNDELEKAKNLVKSEIRYPIAITTYVKDAPGYNSSPHIEWHFPDSSKKETLYNIITNMSKSAGRILRRHIIISAYANNIIFKLDIIGNKTKLPVKKSLFLEWIIDLGIDGLALTKDDKTSYYLPSISIEKEHNIKQMISYLKKQQPQEIVQSSSNKNEFLSTFKTLSWVEKTTPETSKELHAENEQIALKILRGNVIDKTISEERIKQSLQHAGRYLQNKVKESGKFCYTYNPQTDTCSSDYNLLRHAGTTYSMYQIYREYPDEELLKATEKAMEWLRKQIRYIDNPTKRAYLVEDDNGKLGAIGLTLLAMVEREKALGDHADIPIMNMLIEQIIFMKRDDGYLPSFYSVKDASIINGSNSIYYPGEALLGITRLYSIYPEKKYLEAAKSIANFLTLKRWTWLGIEVFTPIDAWLAQALSELYVYAPLPHYKNYTYKIIHNMQTQTLSIDDNVPDDFKGGPAFGASVPSVTPAGSRMEALTAAYKLAVFAKDEEEINIFKKNMRDYSVFQLNQQFMPNNSYFLEYYSKTLGGFRSTPTKQDIRIDYVQHNVSGLLGILHAMKKS